GTLARRRRRRGVEAVAVRAEQQFLPVLEYRGADAEVRAVGALQIAEAPADPALGGDADQLRVPARQHGVVRDDDVAFAAADGDKVGPEADPFAVFAAVVQDAEQRQGRPAHRPVRRRLGDDRFLRGRRPPRLPGLADFLHRLDARAFDQLHVRDVGVIGFGPGGHGALLLMGQTPELDSAVGAAG